MRIPGFSIAIGFCLVLVTRLGGIQAQSPVIPVADQFNNLHFRSIGPAVMSGRFSDVAVFEKNPKIFYLASSHSGLLKTINQTHGDSSGTVVDPNGEPVPNATVVVTPGTFRLSVSVAGRAGTVWSLKSADLSGHDISEAPF